MKRYDDIASNIEFLASNIGLSPRESDALMEIVKREEAEVKETQQQQQPIIMEAQVLKISPTRRQHIPLARVHSIRIHKDDNA
jgi:hypothetical protein